MDDRDFYQRFTDEDGHFEEIVDGHLPAKYRSFLIAQQEILGSNRLNNALEHVVRCAVDLIDCESATISFQEEDQLIVSNSCVRQGDPVQFRSRHINAENSITARVISSNKIVKWDRVQFSEGKHGYEVYRDASGESYSKLIAFPISFENQPMGALVLMRMEDRSFDQDEIFFSRLLSHAITLSLEKDRRQEEYLSVREEMMYGLYAQRLHESLAQNVYILGNSIKAVKELVQDKELRAKDFQKLESTYKDLKEDLSTLLYTSPDITIKSPTYLSVLLQELVEHENQGGCRVVFDSNEAQLQNLPEDVFGVVAALLKECLLNIRKHSSAGYSFFRLEVSQDTVMFSVQNDGVKNHGNDTTSSKTSDGFGLRNLKALVEGLSGTFSAETDKQNETFAVRVTIPWNEG